MLKAVIFDLDGVIVDTKELHYNAWKQFFKKRKININKKRFEGFFGEGNRKTMERYFGKLSEKKFEKLEKDKEKIFLENAKNLKPNPYLLNLLKQLKKNNFLIGLGTSAPKINVNFVLGKLRIKKYFDIIVTEKDVRKPKPAPDVYLAVAKKLKIKPKECVVFEDTIIGIKAAKRAKMRCIAMTTTFQRKKLRSADLIINRFKNINIKKLKRL